MATDTGHAEHDAAVIERSLREPVHFGEVFRRHAPALHRYVARRLGSTDADDISAETFHTAFKQRHRYDLTRPDARPWLWRIATNLVRRQRRSETRFLRALSRTGVDPVVEGHDDRVAELVTAQSVRRGLAEALARLPARDRDVLLLIAWGEMHYREVAEVLSIPVGTVRSRLNRARRRLRAALAHDISDSRQEIAE